MPDGYEVLKPFIKPDGSKAVAGETVPLTPRQAKYLVLAGKIRPVEKARRKTKTASKAKPEA